LLFGHGQVLEIQNGMKFQVLAEVRQSAGKIFLATNDKGCGVNTNGTIQCLVGKIFAGINSIYQNIIKVILRCRFIQLTFPQNSIFDHLIKFLICASLFLKIGQKALQF